jgi:hypothetical protein
VLSDDANIAVDESLECGRGVTFVRPWGWCWGKGSGRFSDGKIICLASVSSLYGDEWTEKVAQQSER